MIYPALGELLKIVDSRYSLVVATAKRARELVDGEEPLVKTKTVKPVSIAVREIYNGKILLDTEANTPAESDFEAPGEDLYA